MNDEFSRVLSQHMEYYSSDPNANKINHVRGEMFHVRNVMVENIDKVLDISDILRVCWNYRNINITQQVLADFFLNY